MAENPYAAKEKELVEFWKKNKIFEKSVKKRPKTKQFVFYDGPPFATGLPHYGHILGLTSKDVFPRFWTMKGYHVERRWGWDCHGLPIENVVEKELGIKDKKEIEKDVAKFNEACRSKVLFFADEWKKTVDRMGKWIEFDNSYKTMDASYMETVWWAFKELYEKELVYEGKRVLMYCPHCQTPLANAEIAMDNSYRDITEKTATVKFQVKGKKDTFLLSWTTTPWTLVGNVALAVNPEITYVKVEVNGEKLILAKNRLEVIKEVHKVLEEFPGRKLVELEYESLYHIASEKKGHYVIDAGTEVSEEEGTGIVHMALYGEFDYEMIKKYDLPVIQHVGHHGKLQLGPEEWIDLWFKNADEKVLEELGQRNLLHAADQYTHSYPFCYRCDTPLFYNAVDSWFIDIHKIKKKILQRGNDINWYPENLKEGRFKNIVKSAPDWNISRNRFWATSIPVWKCTSEDCDHLEVIGSVAELQKKATKKVPDTIDLHKHVMDKIELKCKKCKQLMQRIPEVFDCWVESGSMPYAAKHYPFENKTWLKNNFPADFISEYMGQVRTWFYYMHVLGTALFDKAPFKNVVVTGTILAADGSKMSKSKKNFPDPNMLFETYGADALRFYLMSTQLMRAQDLNFHEEEVKEVYKKVILLLSNVCTFYDMFNTGTTPANKTNSLDIMDQWILGKLQVLVKETTENMENYDVQVVCRDITMFIEALSKWYVRRSRDRFKSNDAVIKKEATQTLAYVLDTLAKLMAPITPFIAETVYTVVQQGKEEESVHLASWPKSKPALIDEILNRKMDTVRTVVSRVLEEREKEKISVRQPLQKVTIYGNVSLGKEYRELIAVETNVKEVGIVKAEKKELEAKLDTKLTPELEQEGFYREVTRRVQSLRKKQGLQPFDKISLVIETDVDLDRFEDALKEKVGAVNLIFGSVASKFKVKVEETLKGKKCNIAFNIL